MNVAYVLSSTSLSGGATKSFLAMLNGVMAEGVRPIIVVPDKNELYHLLTDMNLNVFQTSYRVNTYPWTETPYDILLYLPRLIARRILNWRSTRMLYDYLKDKHIDIIHTNVSVIDIGFRTARKLHIPHIYHIREYIDWDFHLKLYPCKNSLQRSLEKELSYSICITKAIQHHHLQSNKATSTVIYNAISEERSDNFSIGSREYLLFAGRIETAKGLLELVEAYSIANIDIPLWIAGEIIDKKYDLTIKSYIQRQGLSKKILFLGLRNDINELMQHAKALIVPSHYEAFGRCMAEAMFNKCLVVGLNTGGTKEQFDNGLELTGYEIGLRYNNTQELIVQLQKACTMEKEEYHNYIDNASIVVNKLYSTPSHVTKILNFYHDILNKKCV